MVAFTGQLAADNVEALFSKPLIEVAEQIKSQAMSLWLTHFGSNIDSLMFFLNSKHQDTVDTGMNVTVGFFLATLKKSAAAGHPVQSLVYGLDGVTMTDGSAPESDRSDGLFA